MREDAATAGVAGNSYFVQADAENTKLRDSSIHAIACSGMLDHLDLTKTFPELQQIPALGGAILGVETLDYNPIIKRYRRLISDMRTEWEKAHILSLKDIRFARRYFDQGEIRYWHIAHYRGRKVSGSIAVSRRPGRHPDPNRGHPRHCVNIHVRAEVEKLT